MEERGERREISISAPVCAHVHVHKRGGEVSALMKSPFAKSVQAENSSCSLDKILIPNTP